MPEIDKLFEVCAKHGASDLHLKAGCSPVLRVTGTMRALDTPPLTSEDIEKLVYPMLPPVELGKFKESGDLDTAYSAPKIGRFRINLFRQRGKVGMVARRVNSTIPSFVDLNLPPILSKIAMFKQGIALVCGITGSGKSTTLAAMIQHINTHRRCHIVTIEDPIEYMYDDKKALINQREIGLDVESFNTALRAVVRQDPDVILIGEMRDAETFSTALTAAETGHLVFGTLHSSTVPQTFGRIFDIFPQSERDSVRQGLMFNLISVICQKLAPTVDGKGRVPVHEILVMNPTIQKLLQEGKEKKMGDVIRNYQEDGMCDFNQSLYRLAEEGKITKKTALKMSHNPEQLKMNFKGIFISDRGIV